MTALLLADLSHGHADLADILFLAAFIIFVVAGVVVAVTRPVPVHVVLALAGLACVALGWFVL